VTCWSCLDIDAEFVNEVCVFGVKCLWMIYPPPRRLAASGEPLSASRRIFIQVRWVDSSGLRCAMLGVLGPGSY
jgi:hypothetical protein